MAKVVGNLGFTVNESTGAVEGVIGTDGKEYGLSICIKDAALNAIGFRGKNGVMFYPTPDYLSAIALKKWRLALAKQQQGQSPAKIVFLGDSTDVGLYASGSQYTGNFPLSVSAAVAAAFTRSGYTVNTASRFGDGNVGRANLEAYDTRLGVLPAAWVQGLANVIIGGSNCQNSTTTDKLLFTPAGSFQFDRIEVGYVQQTGYDSFNIAVDGGASLLTVNGGAGSLSIQKATATCALGTHTVNIYKQNATATNCSIRYIRCYNSATPAIEIYNWGWSGAKAGNFSSTTSVYSPGNCINEIAPDLTILNLTINDTGANSGGVITDIATYKTNLQIIIDACRVSGDVIARLANPFTGTGSANYAAIRQAYIDVMTANNIPLLDGYGRWVSWADANANGFIADNLHPNRYGYQDYANMLMAVIGSK